MKPLCSDERAAPASADAGAVDLSSAGGVLVAAIRARTPAARAGLAAGDRILAVNGAPLRDAIDFQFHAGDERLALRGVRDGAPFERVGTTS